MIPYEQDFYGWTQEQAALLRAGRLTDLDIDNLIEEIETMGRSEKRELQSRLSVLLMHLLKWHYQPARRGKSWTLTIQIQRVDFMDVLQDNPGLKSQLTDLTANAYRSARINASRETGLDMQTFPVQCPWDFQQITDESFYPD